MCMQEAVFSRSPTFTWSENRNFAVADPPPPWERLYLLHCFSAVGFPLCVHKVSALYAVILGERESAIE